MLQLERLLIFRIGHLGDTVIALPALWALREALPDAHIALLSNADARNPHYVSPSSVLPRNGLIDEWISYPTNRGRAATAAAMAKLAIDLRRRRFDAVVYLMPRTRSSGQIDRDVSFFRFAGIQHVLGAKHLRTHRLQELIPVPTPEVGTEWMFLLDLLRSEGIEANSFRTDLMLTDDERSAAREWFERTTGRTPDAARSVAIAPGSKWESKVWPEARFADVVRRLVSEFDVFPVIFGGEEDREKGERLLAQWNTGANAAGELTVRQSAALLETCSVYLGNDTGTMHLAAAVGTPCVAIFAATDWIGKWTPFGDNNCIFRKRVECEGCHSPVCSRNHECLDLVTADEIHAACGELLK